MNSKNQLSVYDLPHQPSTSKVSPKTELGEALMVSIASL